MKSLILGSPEFYSPTALIIGSLCLGILLSPLGVGVFYLALFLVVWEVIFFGYCIFRQIHWCPPVRATAILAYILGWLIGREITANNAMEPGLPEFLDQWLHPENFPAD